MPNHFVYILQSSDGKYYVGYTTDLEKRMEQHKNGRGSKFVRGFGFSKLLYHEVHATKSKALKREAQLKSWNRAKKKALITGDTGSTSSPQANSQQVNSSR